MTRRLAFAVALAVSCTSLAMVLPQSAPSEGTPQGSAPGVGTPGGASVPGQPGSPDDAATTLTGRIIVKFTEESGLIAPEGISPFPTAGEAGDSAQLNVALSAAGATVTRWIAQPDEVLLELMARAEANTGKHQPDLRQIAYVDPPPGSVLGTADALRGLESVEWVYVERALMMAQCGVNPQPCWDSTGPECAANPFPTPPGTGTPPPVYGCADTPCCLKVSAILPDCSDPESPRGWDYICAQIANIVCEGDLGSDYDVTAVIPGAAAAYPLMLGDCFTARPFNAGAYRGGCNNQSCAFQVCLIDPYCCTLEWDSECVEMAASDAMRQFCGSRLVPGDTPDFTAESVPVTESALINGLGGGVLISYQANRARGWQAYTVGEPVVGFNRFVEVEVPGPPFGPGLEFLESGFRGWGLDLEKMRALALNYSAKSGNAPRINGNGVRVGVIDFAYDEAHEEFVCAAQGPNGACVQLYDTPRVIPEADQTPYSSLPAAERGHGTAVLAMLVAGDNGFGITGIASEAQGYFFPAASLEEGFRLQNAFVSMLLEFEGGDVCVVPLALAPDGGIGPNEIFSQPIVTAEPYATLIGVGSDIGVLTVVPAGNSSAEVLPEPVESQALVVGASMPGQVLETGLDPLCFSTREFTRHVASNFTTGKVPDAIDLFGWGSNVVTAGGLGDLFAGLVPGDLGSRSRWYTKSFGGTSAASAMIGGAAAVLQGFAMQELGVPASPRLLSKSMRNNGVPQGGFPFASPEFQLLSPTAASVLPSGPPGALDLVQARIGFSDFGRANFPQLVGAANDLIFEANDCTFVALNPAAPGAVSPDFAEGLEIEVTLGGGIGEGETCSWYAVATEPWINVTTAVGTGAPLDNTIRYDVETNNDTIEPRDGSIIFIGGNVTQIIPVIQAGCALGAVPGPIVFPPDGTTTGFGLPFDVDLIWNGEECGWTASTTDDWISLVIDSGTGGPPGNVLSFEVAASGLATNREGVITVISTAGLEYDIEITQAPCELIDVQPPAPVFGADGTTGGFGDPAELELTWDGESCGWTASTTTPWITVLTEQGTGVPPGNVIRYEVSPNPGLLQRQGFIRITSAGGSFVNVLVVQGACVLQAFNPPSPAGFGADGTSGGFGDPAEVTLTWNGEDCSWTASTTDAWITVLTTAGTGAPLENVIEFDVAANPTQLPRQGRIRVVSGGGVETYYVIDQGACTLFGANPNPVPPFGPDGTSEDGVPFEVDLLWSGESCTWTATTTYPWITVITPSGSGTPPQNVVKFDVAPNPVTEVPRAGRITVTTAGGQVNQIDITQGPCELLNLPADPIVVDPDGINLIQVPLDWNGNSCEWTASTSANWIVLVQGSGIGDGVVDFSVLPNVTGPFRTGIVLITTTSGEQYPIVVQQAPCALLNAAPNQFNVLSAGIEDAQVVLFLSGEECVWSAAASQPWISVTLGQGTGAPDENILVFDVQPNTGSSDRSGFVTVTGGNGQTQTISVTQEGQVGYDISYTVVTGNETTSYATSRLEYVDDVPVSINAQQANAGGVYQGLTYLSGGKVTDIIFQTVYGGVNAPQPGQPFNIFGLQVRDRAYSTSVSTMRVIYLRNRNTGAWNYLATDQMPVNVYPNGQPPYQVWNLNGSIDPLIYVNPITGRVDVRIWTVVLGNVSANTVRHDYIWAGPVTLTMDGAMVSGGEESDDAAFETGEQIGGDGCVPIALTGVPIRFDAVGTGWAFFEVLLDPEECPWFAVSESDWIEILPSVETVGVARDIVELAVEPFEGPGPQRTGWIRVVTGDGGWARIPIVQAACDLSESRNQQGEESLSLGSQGETGLPISVGAVQGACSWRATSSADWIRLVIDEGTVSDRVGYLIADVSANSTADDRETVVHVSWDNGEHRAIVVRQSGTTVSGSTKAAAGPGKDSSPIDD